MVCAFAISPIDAKKYKNKNSITVKVKDGKKTIKIKCKYTKYGDYYGYKKTNGEKYQADICYQPTKHNLDGKKGWGTRVTDNDGPGTCKYNKNHPVTKIKLKKYRY